MDGSYGYAFAQALGETLEDAGYQVVPDYTYKLVDKATIGIKGKLAYWENLSGEESSRVGNVHLTVYDINTEKVVLNLDQKAAPTIFGAPRQQAFLQSVANVIKQRFCQQQ